MDVHLVHFKAPRWAVVAAIFSAVIAVCVPSVFLALIYSRGIVVCLHEPPLEEECATRRGQIAASTCIVLLVLAALASATQNEKVRLFARAVRQAMRDGTLTRRTQFEITIEH